MSLALVIFILTNLGIVIAYLTIGWFIVPNLNIQYRVTRYSGAAFFGLCAATHTELAVHAWSKTPLTVQDFTSWHMMLIHIPQLIAVCVFTYGLSREVRIANGGRLQLSKVQNILRNTISEIESLRGRVLDDDTLILLEHAVVSARAVQKNLAKIDAQNGSS